MVHTLSPARTTKDGPNHGTLWNSNDAFASESRAHPLRLRLTLGYTPSLTTDETGKPQTVPPHI